MVGLFVKCGRGNVAGPSFGYHRLIYIYLLCFPRDVYYPVMIYSYCARTRSGSGRPRHAPEYVHTIMNFGNRGERGTRERVGGEMEGRQVWGEGEGWVNAGECVEEEKVGKEAMREGT